MVDMSILSAFIPKTVIARFVEELRRLKSINHAKELLCQVPFRAPQGQDSHTQGS